ncbi:MAG: DUF3365 domain-containing protein [Roseofilum sp. SBFL]|uniref:Tll0287-like domain-containing protein n=1 Tax=unclassified Roseofilum TaxID=2620099 RepID=UPI001B0163A4|nr:MULTISPECIES: DUF3365 domain-containing protein [unclassified Roseofilum]MBP0012754.1 DUF3365 domain-containing protein [Roseofilum sp. SID3]MBP0026272.1 DUF3365 domain-containing protein [Roseofilum sp. SID2]MBP0037090.1 DUF3365 domain-containing protein [Roseofilum sp. SID1]MBP0043504.1 DUF3365 domain-containing protein [Roseofilum sp. SBFL]
MKPIELLAMGTLLLCLTVLSLCAPQTALANPDPGQLSHAIEEIENLDAMRSGLASTLKDRTKAITPQTFKQVCKPVGMKAKQLSQENGWQVKQIAVKYRNPAHAPNTPEAEAALELLDNYPELMGFWQDETLNGQPGQHYYRRINVEATCLGCHGAKAARPEFVKQNYPQDLAYDFKVGDLRGMYAVFIPDPVASESE